MAARVEITDMVFRNVGGNMLAHPGAAAAVQDLSGNNLTVYQDETGSPTFTNPLTSDANGQIEGWVEALDFDIAVSGAGITAYTQRVRQSPPGTYAVESYGAKVDGSTNDAAAVQAALDAIETAGKGKLTFSKPGVCKINTALTYDASNLEVDIGPGVEVNFADLAANGVLLTIAGTQGSTVALTANAAVGATSLTIAAGAESGFAAGDLVKVTSTLVFDTGRTDTQIGEIAEVLSTASGSLTLRSPLMSSQAYNTADTAGVRKLTARENITIRGAGKVVGGGTADNHIAFKVQTCRHLRIRDIRVDDADSVGFQIWDTLDATVDGVKVTGATGATSGGYGVSFVNACQGGMTVNSHFRNCRHATSTNNSATGGHGLPRHITTESCKVWDSSSGNDALDTHAAAEYISFLFNEVYDAGNVGINIECPKATVIGNTIVRAGNRGVYLVNYATVGEVDYTVLGNRIISPADSGIQYTTPSSAVAQTIRSIQIADNKVYNATSIGIYCESTQSWRLHNTQVVGNHIDAAQSGTASIYVTKGDAVTITGNQVTNAPNASTCIRITDVTSSTVTGNTVRWISAGTNRGFRVLSGVDNVICGNTVENAAAGSIGVELDSASTNNLVVGNNVRGTTTGLSLSTGAGNMARANLGATGLATIASTATVALVGSENDVFLISGTAAITSITASYAGRRITLIFTGTAAAAGLTDGSNLKLSANLAYTPDDAITLLCDGTNWYETGRSVN